MAGGQHILVIRFSAMGDVAMSVPVLRALSDQNPSVKITCVSRPEFAEFFRGIPGLTFFPADLDNNYKGLHGLLNLYRDIKKAAQYTSLADIHDNLRTKILRKLFRLSGLTYAYIDKGRAEKKLLTRFPQKVLKPLQLTTERYADVFRKLGFQIVLNQKLTKRPAILSDELTAITGQKTNTWIGIAPFAKHKGKIYPLERTEKVIGILNNQNARDVSFWWFRFGGRNL